MAVTLSFTTSLPPTAAQLAGAAAIRDLALDSTTNDLVPDPGNGDLTFVSGIAAIASDLGSRWRTFKREYFLDLTMGVDYWGVVFVKPVDLGAIEQEFRREALACPGVTAATITATRLPDRQLRVVGEITVDTGQIFIATLDVNQGNTGA